MAAFVDEWRDSDQKVVLHVVKMPGEFVNGKGEVGNASSFLEVISLVR